MTKKFKKVPAETRVSDLTPLMISCSSTKCEVGLHCFRPDGRIKKERGNAGVCTDCGEANAVDWARVRKMDINDAENTFQSLKKELIRHVMWNTPLKDHAIEEATKLGKSKLKLKSLKVLTQRIGGPANDWDGRQTPYEDSIISYAQHATATCCRKCLAYWFDIPKDEKLNDDQLNFLSELVMKYVDARVPGLTEEGDEND